MMEQRRTRAKNRQKLLAIHLWGKNLFRWEEDFVCRLLNSGVDDFTPRQVAVIEKIYDRRVSREEEPRNQDNG